MKDKDTIMLEEAYENITRHIVLADSEIPKFDKSYGWYASTRVGIIHQIWKKDDPRQMDPTILDDAILAVKHIITTKKPLVGGWS